MASIPALLTKTEAARFSVSPVKSKRLMYRITSLADFFAVISTTFTTSDTFWFRGVEDVRYSLVPSALRYADKTQRRSALDLIAEFKRVAEIKLARPPQPKEELMWAQLAQHHGLPTRLLDWTESATTALFFACLKTSLDGLVFILNPIDLNRVSYPDRPRILNPHLDSEVIRKYLRLGFEERKNGRSPIAVNPVPNSERLLIQKGVFTLHGTRFAIDPKHVYSLVGIPILREFKARLRSDLQRVGVDEMTLFPELEHACIHLKRHAGLISWD